jgi:Zn-dependent protease
VELQFDTKKAFQMVELIILLPVLLFSVILHEYAHGWMAEKFGDDTARVMGRLTFNPIPHIDPIGTIVLPGLALLTHMPVFGWAKPVPVDQYRLRNPQRDMIWVSLAGPMSNFMLAVIASLLMWVVRAYPVLPQGLAVSAYQLFFIIMQLNVVLFTFNLFPIPPLDGSRVVAGILPQKLAYQYAQLEQYGFIIIIALLSTGVFSAVLGPVVNFFVVYLSGTRFMM